MGETPSIDGDNSIGTISLHVINVRLKYNDLFSMHTSTGYSLSKERERVAVVVVSIPLFPPYNDNWYALATVNVVERRQRTLLYTLGVEGIKQIEGVNFD